MASDSPDERSHEPTGLQSMLARLRGMMHALRGAESESTSAQEMMPTWDVPVEPVIIPASPAEPMVGEIPEALPVPEAAVAELPAEPIGIEHGVVAGIYHPETVPASPVTESSLAPQESSESADDESPQPFVCPACGSPRQPDNSYCDDCGFMFPPESQSAASRATAPSRIVLRGRFELGARLAERQGVARFRGMDVGDGSQPPVPVIILRSTVSEAAAVPVENMPISDPVVEAAPDPSTADTLPMAIVQAFDGAWPSIRWEQALLRKSAHLSLPAVVDQFIENEWEYLVEEIPRGTSLWDAWDNPAATAEERFGWLIQIAEAMRSLHENGGFLESIRPDTIVIGPSGDARLADLGALLPLPFLPDPPLSGSFYAAPELVLSLERADARAGLYSFGALLYALHMGHELTELDFELQGVPKSFISRFPDAHPLFARLISKTFCRDVSNRFPTEEAAREDATGFTELIRTLEVCRASLDRGRLEIAAWTTTGMVRTGNEDAFTVLHTVESREDTLAEGVLILLADGMGGYEAGELAARLAVDCMRRFLVQRPPFSSLADVPMISDAVDAQPVAFQPHDPAAIQQQLAEALRDANKRVFDASSGPRGRRAMGCTAEAVYSDGRYLLVGHVGDSRTYHLHRGELIQVTRDQTWVNRLLDIGALTAEEAENHPRRSELQQAIGGRAEVDPALYQSTLRAGDWVLVCSDGLSNHLTADALKDLLQASTSAESAARRLVNFVNLEGATDNATVAVIRVT